jgi:putative oxidoreductase
MADKNGHSKDLGLLIIRVGIGIMFAIFGWGKLKGGPELWQGLGSAMGVFGITAWPVFWGFMAMFAEFAGGLMLILGLLVRPFAALMCFTMITAAALLMGQGKDMQSYSHAVDMAVVFAGLMIAGGGRFALGAQITGLGDKWYR